MNIESVIRRLGKYYSKSYCDEPFKVLIGTILSQRTKDENTSKASEKLFSVYRTPEQLAKANVKNIERLIKSSGFYKVKAKRIKKVSKIILEKYNDKVPDNLKNLLSLPGVGRKTANCVLVYAFDKPAIPVDVHVHRISNRLGLVKTKTPEETEKALMKKIPKRYWKKINHMFVEFGKNVCSARPKCEKCPLSNCPSRKKH